MLCTAHTGFLDFEGWHPSTTVSPYLMVVLLHPRFRMTGGVGRNSAPHFTICPFSSFTSKKSDGWGKLKSNSVTVPVTVIVLSISYEIDVTCENRRREEHGGDNDDAREL